MGFASESGYVPVSIETMMATVMANINTQFGTSYTNETFVGTNFYKYFYALIQELQKSEIKTSEIFLKLQDYIAFTNEAISRPAVTPPGLIETLLENGFVASVKPPLDADAGKIFICVDLDDGVNAEGTSEITNYANLVSGTADTITVGGTTFTAQASPASPGSATFQAATSNSATATSLAAQINAHATAGALVKAKANGAIVTITARSGGTGGNSIALSYVSNGTVGATVSGATLTGGVTRSEYADEKLEVATIIKNSVAAGIVSQGTEVTAIVLSNAQSFDFKFNLPNKIEVLLRLTITLSENNQFVVKTPEEVKDILLANIEERYTLGKNFEPQRYFSLIDAPWASDVLLEYSVDDGANWESEVYDSDYDELFDVLLENITVIEA
jgi:hypothetical protein